MAADTLSAPVVPDALARWEPLSLNLIAFPAELPIAADRDWWRDLVGRDCESQRKRGFERIHTGACEGGRLTLSIDPLKFTFSLAPESTDEGVATLGPFDRFKPRFDRLAADWLSRLPALRRIAFAGRLFLPTQDHDAGYAMLARFLPGIRVDLDSSEFSYRINRRRRTAVHAAAFEINRLAAWALLDVKFPNRAGNSTAGLRKRQGCLLEFDYNTPSEHTGGFDPETGRSLFAELSALVAETAACGDRK